MRMMIYHERLNAGVLPVLPGKEGALYSFGKGDLSPGGFDYRDLNFQLFQSEDEIMRQDYFSVCRFEVCIGGK